MTVFALGLPIVSPLAFLEWSSLRSSLIMHELQHVLIRVSSHCFARRLPSCVQYSFLSASIRLRLVNAFPFIFIRANVLCSSACCSCLRLFLCMVPHTSTYFLLLSLNQFHASSVFSHIPCCRNVAHGMPVLFELLSRLSPCYSCPLVQNARCCELIQLSFRLFLTSSNSRSHSAHLALYVSVSVLSRGGQTTVVSSV